MLMALLHRWLMFGWVGKTAWLVAVLYGTGWVSSKLGMEAAAREFGSAGAIMLSVLLTALVIRTVWRRHAGSGTGARLR